MKKRKKNTKTTTLSKEERGELEGYRSGLEETLASELKARKVDFQFEPFKISYLQPAKCRKYLPDFIINRGRTSLIIETKGRFTTADRQKHLLIKKQHPELDIRFVFQNPRARISKTSKTTYAMWCEKNGFLFYKKTVPEEWLNE